MLQAIRERSQGLIVAIIVGFISLTFALWGVESYVSAGRQVVVAEVDGEEILLTEFQDTLQRVRQQAQSALGEAYADIDWNSAEVKERTLDQLINERLVGKLVAESNMRVADLQVARQIQQVPAFQDENGFSRALYEQRLPQIGMTQAGFERQLREDMVKAQLRAGIAASEFVTAGEAREIERLRQQKRDIAYAIIPASAYTDRIAVSEADARAYYESNKEAFRRDEQVRLEYIALSPAALESEVSVTEAALRAHYEANLAAYTVEEQRNVNHILIQVGPTADAEETAAAQTKAAAALARARAGESFEALAEELSDDIGSRLEGGETGLFPRGVMAPEFEEAAFALAVGEISEPVRTRFGFHILKLKAVEPGGQRTFEEARADVEQAYRAAQAQQMFFDQAEQFSNLVYEHPDTLAVAADAVGLEVEQTELLTRDDIAMLFSPQAAARAFETEVLVEGLNAEPVELPDGRVVALRVAAHEPAVVPPFETVRDEVVERVRNEQLRARTAEAGNALLERLRAGEEASKVMSGDGFDWKQARGVGRESTDVNRAVLRAAFGATATPGAPTYLGVPVGTTDYAVIEIGNVQTPAPDDVAKSAVVGVQRELIEGRAALAWQDFLEALRARSEVKVYPRNL